MRSPFRFAFALSIAAMAIAPLAAHADATGTTVTGSLQGMYYDNQGNVSYGSDLFPNSSAIIGPGVEFTFEESFSLGTNEIQANFTGSSLSIFTSSPSNFIDHQLTFTDPSFFGVTYLDSDPEVHTSFSGDTITIQFLNPPLGYHNVPYDQTDVFSIQTSPSIMPSATPEPSGLLLLGTGLLGIAAATRRRFLAPAGQTA